MTYVLFAIGFLFLIKGADWLIKGASAIAKRYKVSNLLIGLTLVAIGTSAPELVINIFSNIQGSPGIAIGNILGSNIANILLILGIAACIYPLTLKKTTIYREIPFSIAAILLLNVLINDTTIRDLPINILTRREGILLLFCFILFFIYLFVRQRNNKETLPGIEIQELSWKKSLLEIGAGLVGLIIGGQRIVKGSIAIATLAGLSETTIGLTIVAIGTSLPELATSIVAILKRKPDIAIGNIVGSNILNIFLVLGVSASIQPILLEHAVGRDVWFVIFASMILLAFTIARKGFTIRRYQGFLMVIAYIVYILIVLMDNF